MRIMMKILYATLAMLFLTSCGTDSHKVDEPSRSVSREQAVGIAEQASRKAMLIPRQVQPQVDESDTAFIITYPMTLSKQQPPVRGPDYYTKVTVDKQTGMITKLLVAP